MAGIKDDLDLDDEKMEELMNLDVSVFNSVCIVVDHPCSRKLRGVCIIIIYL